jgi:hypothetical protein
MQGSGEVHTGFWSRNLSKRDHWEELNINVRIILKWIFKKWDEGAQTGLIWLRIWTGLRLL